MILADTSVWVDHLRRGLPRLVELLEAGEVLCHPFVIGELACGNLENRRTILALLGKLPPATVAGHDEVLALIDVRRLSGRGIGWVDAHLLASTALTHCELWTRDKRLGAVAQELGAAFEA